MHTDSPLYWMVDSFHTSHFSIQSFLSPFYSPFSLANLNLCSRTVTNQNWFCTTATVPMVLYSLFSLHLDVQLCPVSHGDRGISRLLNDSQCHTFHNPMVTGEICRSQQQYLLYNYCTSRETFVTIGTQKSKMKG